MNPKVTLGALVCFSVVGVSGLGVNAQEIDINNKKIVQRKLNIKERYVDSDNVPVKKGSSNIADELGCLAKNDKVEVISVEGEWATINYEGGHGYIQLKYLKKSEENISDMYIDGIEKANVFEEPMESSKLLGYIKIGSKVRVLNDLGEYIKIEFNNKPGYIKKEYLVEKLTRTINKDTSLDKNSDEDKEIILRSGENVDVIELGAEKTKINCDGSERSIPTENISDIKYLVNGKTELLVSPSKGSKVKTCIPQGTGVDIISYNGDYVKVKFDLYEGYIKKDCISKDRYTEEMKIMKETYATNEVVSRNVIEKDLEEEMASLKVSSKSSEVLSKAKANVIDKYNIEEIEVGSLVKITSNKGAYLEVEHKGDAKIIENKGVSVKDKNEMKYIYIHTDKEYEIDKDVRFTNKDDVEVYKDAEKKYILGYLVKDSKVKFIKDLENGVSEITINGSTAYIENEHLNIRKMYVNNNESIKYVNTNLSHQVYVDKLYKNLNMNLTLEGTKKADYEELALYSNPRKMSVNNAENKYQYLKLNKFRKVNVAQLDEYLSAINTGKKNVFKDKAEVFVNAAKEYNIDPIYLVAHTLVETGYGSSKLAQGIKDINGVTVYNFFGIGAVDSSPIDGGIDVASKEGWTSIDKAIYGSAKWLANNYIHSPSYHQNTLYKMRYNKTAKHLYATDIGWAKKISKFMNELSYMYEDEYLEFEVPVYKKGTDAVNRVKEDEKVEEDKGYLDEDKDDSNDNNEVDVDSDKSEDGNVEEKPSKPVVDDTSDAVDEEKKDEEISNEELSDEPSDEATDKPGESKDEE